VGVADTTTTSENSLVRFSFTTLTDEFDSINSSVWTTTQAGGATVTDLNEQLIITYPLACTSATDGDITTIWDYDLTNGRASIQVITVPSSLTNADAELRLFIDSNNWLRWVYEAGTLYAQYMVGGVKTTPYSAAYSQSTQLYWRIRESAGNVIWETSSDGTTFTSRATVADPIAVNSLQAKIMGSCYQVEVNPGQFVVEDFNIFLGIVEANDTTNTSETVALLMTSFINVRDIIATSENINLNILSFISAQDTATSSEVTILTLFSFINAADTATTSESRAIELISFINIGDTSTTSEDESVNIGGTLYFITTGDTINTTESILILEAIISSVGELTLLGVG